MSNASLPLWAALPAALLAICGGAFALIGSIGLLRMKTFYARMHPPTMGTTLGVGCVLIASMLVFSATLQRPVIHEVLIILFVVITSPISAMTLMRAAIRRTGVYGDYPSN
jgi:multicomponent K+:H+ antiporter subunit G